MYPPSITQPNLVAHSPRRVRALAGGRVVFETTRALYVWEWPHFPQYYVPAADVDMSLLVAYGDRYENPQGTVQPYDLVIDGSLRNRAARHVITSSLPNVANTVRFSWDALDHWFEEDEEVFVHPRDPYHRVDVLRSHRSVRVELDGVVLAESNSPIMLFETGVPERYYLDQASVRFERLVPSETRTGCPYKGRTTRYWSIAFGDQHVVDAAWTYDFPTGATLPTAGLVAFLSEKVDIFLDGVEQPRPVTHFS